jgi:hypothetical protein
MLCIVNKVIPAKAGAFRYPGALLPGVIEQLPSRAQKNRGRNVLPRFKARIVFNPSVLCPQSSVLCPLSDAENFLHPTRYRPLPAAK